ncbi:MAG: cation acetate symporter [Verrucomicrobiales bacterium]|nr:cation acetate symporter [Verrucomicrobiales bacterium]
MGFWAAGKSRTASDFFVAGRGVSVGWNASAISGEYLSAASFMGIAGMVMSSGYDALWYPVCYACGYLFLLLFIAGPLRRFGAYTIPDFAEGRYDSPVFRKIAVVFVLFIGFFYTMPQMKGAGTTLAYIFPGLPYWVGVVLVGAVITFNVALGGMKGITLVQAFQYWVKMFAIAVPVFVLMAVYGHYGRQLGVNGADPAGIPAEARKPLPAKAPSDAAWSQPFGPLTTKAVAASTAGPIYQGPMVTNRFPLFADLRSAAHVAALKTGLAQAPLAVFDGSPVPVGQLLYNYASAQVLANLLDPSPAMTLELAQSLEGATLSPPPSTGGHPDPSTSVRILKGLLDSAGVTVVRDGSRFLAFPTRDAVVRKLDSRPYALLYTYSLIMALVCGTAGLPHILVRFYTNPDGVAAKRTTMWVMILIGVFYVFPPVFGVIGRNLMPELYAGVGAKGTDKIVLELPRILNERYGVLGSVLSGVTCAGAFAAFMSTFSGLLVSMTGALAHDVYGRILRPGSSAAERMRMFKVFAWLIGGVATLLGCFVEPLQINFMVGQAFAIAAASYFPLLFMSVWWRGMTMRGAATGMLGGGVAAVIAVSVTNFSDLGWIPLKAFWIEHPLLRILCEQPAIWAVPGAIALMVLISKATRREVPADIRMKMLVLHAPEALGLKQEYIREHEAGH